MVNCQTILEEEQTIVVRKGDDVLIIVHRLVSEHGIRHHINEGDTVSIHPEQGGFFVSNEPVQIVPKRTDAVGMGEIAKLVV